VIGKVRGLFSWLPTGEILPGMTDDEHDEMGRAWSSRSGCSPTCSASANDRQSAADGNVPVPAPTLRRIKLLHEMPSPSSDWTARQPHARGWLG
jgi:hypothetical protein